MVVVASETIRLAVIRGAVHLPSTLAVKRN
jgi:hypothetical protein